MPTLRILLLMLVCICTANAFAQDYFRAHNTYPKNISLWVWPKSMGKWDASKPYIVRGSSEKVPITDMGRHYLMTKDEQGRERHLGWHTYSELFENVEPREIFLGQETRTRTETYPVSVAYTEHVEQTYTVSVPKNRTRTVIRNGVPVTVNYTVIETETRTRMVPLTSSRTEIRTKEVQFVTPTLSVRRGGQLQVARGAFGTRTIGVSFHISSQGMHISKVKSGSPAQKCRDESGRLYALVSGDHIISIDGVRPVSVEQVKNVIGNSRTDMQIRVLGKDGVTTRDLIISPR